MSYNEDKSPYKYPTAAGEHSTPTTIDKQLDNLKAQFELGFLSLSGYLRALSNILECLNDFDIIELGKLRVRISVVLLELSTTKQDQDGVCVPKEGL